MCGDTREVGVMSQMCKCKTRKPGSVVETDPSYKYCALCGDELLPLKCRYCQRADKIDTYQEYDSTIGMVNKVYAEHLRKDHCVCHLGGIQ